MSNCLNVSLKESVPNAELMYLEKGVLIFDNTINPNQPTVAQTVGYGMAAKPVLVSGTAPGTLASDKITYPTSTAAKTLSVFTYKLTDVTKIKGISGSGYSGTKGNFKWFIRDVKRCINMTDFVPNGIMMGDGEFDLSVFAENLKIQQIDMSGQFAGQIKGDVDILDFIDMQVENGRNLLVDDYLCIRSFSSKLTFNGISLNTITPSTKYTHFVFSATGYKVYSDQSSNAKLADYSELTPYYEKTF